MALHQFVRSPVTCNQMPAVLFVKAKSNILISLFFQGYLPANVDRRESTLQRKRKEYFAFVEQYYDSRNDENHQDTYRQVEHLLN